MWKQCINELKQVQKNSSCSIYTWRGDVTGVIADAAWTPPMTLLAGLYPTSSSRAPGSSIPGRDGSWKEGISVGIYRQLKMLELLGMTSSCRLVPWNWMVLQSSTMPQVILKNMFNLPWSLRVWSGSKPKSLTIVDTEVGGLVRRWGTLLTKNLAALRWTISSWSIYFCWYGSQIQEQVF